MSDYLCGILILDIYTENMKIIYQQFWDQFPRRSNINCRLSAFLRVDVDEVSASIIFPLLVLPGIVCDAYVVH